MSTISTASNGYDRRRELQAFDDTKAGVKGLVDAGVITVPAIFHHPPDSLPVAPWSSADVTIPVIDLSGASRAARRRGEVVGQVKAAAETVGFFQVVNHGVPGEVLAEMLAAVRRFHEEPAEVKRPYYTRDVANKVRFNSNFDLFQSPAANWRDTLFCQVAPEPPRPEELPVAVREIMLGYGDAVRKLAVAVLELLSEALGLAAGHLEEMGCVEGISVVSNYYPPCPQPHLTLGTSRHSDPAFLTVLLQDDMGGLQVLAHDLHGDHWHWVDVPPVPDALVINIGDLLQLVSNKRLKSVEHRVVASSKRAARISVASFCNTNLRTSTRLYGPIKQLTSDMDNPPLYRGTTVGEFLSHYDSKGLDGRPALDYFLLHPAS